MTFIHLFWVAFSTVMGCRSDDVRRQAFLHGSGLNELIKFGRELEGMYSQFCLFIGRKVNRIQFFRLVGIGGFLFAGCHHFSYFTSDETDAGLLTSGGEVVSVFLPDSAVSLLRLGSPSAQEQKTSSPPHPHSDYDQPRPYTRAPPHQQQQQHHPQLNHHQQIHHISTNGTSSEAAGHSRNGPSTREGPAAEHPLSQFDDLSLAQYPEGGSGTLNRDGKRLLKMKEKTKERRRQQRKVRREVT